MATTLTRAPHKTLPIIFLLLVFLVTLLLFSKRSIDPHLPIYTSTDPYNPLPDPQIPHPDSISTEKPPILEPKSTDLELLNNDSILKNETGFVESESVDQNPFVESNSDESESVKDDDLIVEKSSVLDDEWVKKSVDWGRGCNMYSGKWVRDDEYPIYKPGSCPFVDEAFDCQANGRADEDYMKWRWQPDQCELPRFNATDFLVRLRGKRLLLVGDSMNRNQFESLLCMLYESLPNKSKMYEINGNKITKGRGYFVFKFEDYNCTVEFVRSHFLVREGTRINGQGNSNPTLSMDVIDKSARRWKRADILVFNTGHWWVHGKTSRGKNYFKEGDYIYPKFDAVEAFRRALKTWGKWIDKNMNQNKLVFYRGYSSAHFRGGEWDSGGTCHGETDPIKTGRIIETYPPKMKIIEEVIQEMRFPVVLLNVTRSTNFRKDGHPSVYGKNVTGLKKVSTKKEDCSHWCLPGVPDAWNELIYATLAAAQTN
ncbi:putative PMR5 domain, PC-Esterase, protein trichome birefringence-like 5 [Helianthus annuus]|uniref:PMR5 domain, PC-Esterase n=1 Tax=Helianthus annuus TaxID=4232 RepID=A0A251TP43_HELAN|nr:protein trichome birefringence-like 5 [Helianthus annuus]KAF5787634.1 putative PMR5 domain, PC-Esterase [Helianthus annuus]KAJ0514839.1 putative PMR5 domain, PC-Esterase, protein trichome birefringence-like 5 [Helianthus annuus]KAJ0523154.1 putative PMR5 domain, PC-Esterase, protein trichome birefringence-like 5 [Helianthus annuus]KAJ0531003.1 putative PMR5 domain, PC-Esterase [Helianthus annuus]KAJ0701222.1 putative PMR5 domain, PC-Esterase, protein trichome birefringence-like 5 [Helianthu